MARHRLQPFETGARMSAISQRRLDASFTLLEHAAINGIRCPTHSQGMGPEITTALARAGRILVQVSGRNWKTVTILTGPARGMTTKSDPHQHQVFLTVDQFGTWMAGNRISGGLPRPTARMMRAEDDAIREAPAL
jgi:hypothetical protein